MAFTPYIENAPKKFAEFVEKHGRAPLSCKYCGASELQQAIIYKVTGVCLDCALVRGSDK